MKNFALIALATMLPFGVICQTSPAFISPNLAPQNIGPQSKCVNVHTEGQVLMGIEKNIANLRDKGLLNVLATWDSIGPLSLGNPIATSPDWEVHNSHVYSGYRDNDPTGGVWEDYNCGTDGYDGHNGVDIITWPFPWYAKEHDYVWAVASESGILVQKVDSNRDDFCSVVGGAQANLIALLHADSNKTLYYHIKKGSALNKNIGDTVAKGEYLGVIASAGQSTASHLHFEIRDVNNNVIDPFYSSTCTSNTTVSQSWWTSQETYRKPALNGMFTHYEWPATGCPDSNEATYFTSQYSAGDLARFSVFSSHVDVPDSMEFTLYTNTGSLYVTNMIKPTTYYGTYQANLGYFIPSSGADGIWTYKVVLGNDSMVKTFRVGAVSLGFPLSVDPSWGVNQGYAISQHFDHDPDPGDVLDYNCGDQTYDGHNAIDYRVWPFPWLAKANDYVSAVAAADGEIIGKGDGNRDDYCSWVGGAQANYITLRHDDSSMTGYLHLKSGSLTSKGVGDQVSAGEFLGIVGSSGISSTVHLHFSVRDKDGNYLDPYDGLCDSTFSGSMWENQPNYRNPIINAIFSHDKVPVVGCPDSNEVPNFSTSFSPGDTLWLSQFYSHMDSLDTMRMYLHNDTGGLIWNRTRSTSSFSRTGWWVYWQTLSSSITPGQYTYSAVFDGDTLTHDVYVRDTIYSKANGNWSDTATWFGTSLPEQYQDVIISGGHEVTVDTVAECGSLSLLDDGTKLIVNTSKSLEVKSNLYVQASSSSDSIVLEVNGSLSVGEDYYLSDDGNASCHILLSGSGLSQFVSKFDINAQASGLNVDVETKISSSLGSCQIRTESLCNLELNLKDSLSVAEFILGAQGSQSDVDVSCDFSSSMLRTSGIEFSANGGLFSGGTSGGTVRLRNANELNLASGISYDKLVIESTSAINSLTASSLNLHDALVIEVGGSLDLNGTDLTLSGDLEVDGSLLTDGTETFTFTSIGLDTHEIRGSGQLEIGLLRLATHPNGGLTINSSSLLDVMVGLELDSGRLKTNDNVRLFSDETNTAYLGKLDTNASIVDGLIYRKHIPSLVSNADWRYIHPPSQGAPISDLEHGTSPNGIYSYGYVGSNQGTSTLPYVSSYTYIETQGDSGGNGFGDGWKYDDSPSNTIDYESARIFYTGGSQGAGAKSSYILESSADPVTGSVNIGLANSGQSGTSAEDGWNLLGNPYACPVIVNSEKMTNIQGNEIYVWNPTIGSWTALDSGSTLAQWQSFFIQVIADSTGGIQFDESDKLESSTATYIKRAKKRDVLTFKLYSNQDPSLYTEIETRLLKGAKLDFDRYDGHSLDNAAPFANMAFVVEDSVRLRANRVPHDINSFSVPIEIEVVTPGTYTIESADVPLFTTCQTITDLDLDTTMDVDNNFSYSFYQSNPNPVRRFRLNLSSPRTEFSSEATSCFADSDGTIELDPANGFGAYHVLISDPNGNHILNKVDSHLTQLNGLKAGVYTTYITDLDSTCTSIKEVEVFEPSEVVSSFSVSNPNPNIDTAFNESVHFQNLSNGASSFTWNFGDGTPLSFVPNPNHLYSSVGKYEVVLVSSNGDQDCDRQSSAEINVVNNPLSRNLKQAELGIHLHVEASTLKVELLGSQKMMAYSVSDIQGRPLLENSKANESSLTVLDISALNSGIYSIRCWTKSGDLYTELFVKM